MEEMLPRQKASYSTLVAQLAAALHAEHRKLAIYAVRRTATDVDDGAAAYDWTALAARRDLVLASGYNEHSATTAPGPVTTRAGFAALALVRRGDVAAKVAPTMGAFGYQWTGGGARMISSAGRRAALAGRAPSPAAPTAVRRSRARRRLVRVGRGPVGAGADGAPRGPRSGSGCSRSAASPSASGSARSCGSAAAAGSVARDRQRRLSPRPT